MFWKVLRILLNAVLLACATIAIVKIWTLEGLSPVTASCFTAMLLVLVVGILGLLAEDIRRP